TRGGALPARCRLAAGTANRAIGLGDRQRELYRPGGNARQESLLLRRRATLLDRPGAEQRAEEWAGRQETAHLAQNHRELDAGKAEAAMLLIDHHARPAHRRDLAPVAVVVRVG